MAWKTKAILNERPPAAIVDHFMYCLLYTSAVACQVPVQIAEYSFNEAVKYVNGDTKIDEKKVYLDSHLVLKDEAEKTLKEWQ